MKLVVSTPTSIAVDRADIVSLRAEDESGSFGILPAHAALMTVLAPSVLSWRDSEGREGFCAVRGGVLSVEGGKLVAVATREAVVGDDFERLESEVLRRFRASVAEEEKARVGEARLQAALVRQILSYLRPERDGHVLSAARGPLSSLE